MSRSSIDADQMPPPRYPNDLQSALIDAALAEDRSKIASHAVYCSAKTNLW
jgi:hypothetical protein